MRSLSASLLWSLLVPALLMPACVDYNMNTPCNSDSDCKADEFCFAGLCRDKVECAGDQDCPEGHVCLEGTCQPPACVKDEDCPDDERCFDYECTPCGCLTNADCPPDQICKDSCICTEPEIVPCDTDADCPPWERCVDGACQALPPCDTDADCDAGMVCEQGICIDGCASDADCPQLNQCVDGRCRQQCVGDAFCFGQDQICEDGVCVDAECLDDSDCQGEFVRCQAGRCEPYTACEADADCEANFTCIDGICEELPLCAIDQNCQPGELCEDGHCHQATGCAADADCADDEDCVGGLCVPHVCRGPADCPADQACVGGECIDPGDPARVYEVIILTPGGPITPSQQIQLTAIALTQSGEAVPGVAFSWSSTEPARATVDADGVLTGGDEAGETRVRAQAIGTNRESRPVAFVNILDPAADQLRVTAVAAGDREPIEGATVIAVQGGLAVQATTGPEGTASFDLGDPPADVHVFAEGRDAVSVLSTSSTDLLIPLPERHDETEAGGYTGQMSVEGDGALAMGLAGLSVGGDLLSLDFGSLLGEVWRIPVDLAGYAFELPLPAQMTLGVSFQGIPITIKDGYHVVGQAGLRSAWAMGGTLDISVLGQLFGGISIGDLLGSLFPYFSLLNHGIRPVYDVHPLPLVVDEDDVDRDGDTQELRPDWDNFLDVDLAPDQPQTLALSVAVPEPPTRRGTPVGTALVVAGGLGELGFTPLGLSSTQADNGAFEPVLMRMAPAHGGLEVGAYAVVVLALPGTASLAAPRDVAAVIQSGADLPADVDFADGFVAFPEDAVFHRPTRTLLASAVAGAEVFRLELAGPDGGWTVWLPGDDLINASLPAPPAGFTDPVPTAGASFSAIRLAPGVGFEDLVTLNGDDLDQFNRLARAYSRVELD